MNDTPDVPFIDAAVVRAVGGADQPTVGTPHEPEPRESPQRGVLAMTVRVIQAISSAEMMISAMPTTVSTEWLLHHRIPIGGPTCAR